MVAASASARATIGTAPAGASAARDRRICRSWALLPGSEPVSGTVSTTWVSSSWTKLAPVGSCAERPSPANSHSSPKAVTGEFCWRPAHSMAGAASTRSTSPGAGISSAPASVAAATAAALKRSINSAMGSLARSMPATASGPGMMHTASAFAP